MGFSRNSDPYGSAYFPHRPHCIAKPQGASGAEVQAVLLRANRNGLSESARASSKVDQGRLVASKAHEMDTIKRLKGAQQDAGSDTAGFARDVHQKVQTVGAINVRVPVIEKQRLVSRPESSVGMPGGVAHYVSFCFHDPPAHSAGPSIMHERLSD
jgi:hypothetical protein